MKRIDTRLGVKQARSRAVIVRYTVKEFEALVRAAKKSRSLSEWMHETSLRAAKRESQARGQEERR